MDWKIDISHIKGGYIEQAKVEAERQIAEQLEQLKCATQTIAEMLQQHWSK